MTTAPTLAATKLSREASKSDIEMCFLLVLGRQTARASDIEFHLNAPVYSVLQHILSSREFADRVLPNLGPGIAGPLSARPLPPELKAWAVDVFGPGVAAGCTLWTDLLVACIAHPDLARNLVRRATLWGALTAQLPALTPPAAPAAKTEPAAPPPPPPAPAAWDETADMPLSETAEAAAEVIEDAAPEAQTFAPEAAAVANSHHRVSDISCLFFPPDYPVAHFIQVDALTLARRWLLAAEFRSLVLEPLAVGAIPPGVADVVVTAEQAWLAASTFFGDRLGTEALGGDQPWTRSLMRLLLHPDSVLCLDDAIWGASPADAPVLAELRQLAEAAFAHLAAADPVLRLLGFLAPADARVATALFTFVLGRVPAPVDRIAEVCRRGYPAALLRFFLAPEFEREVLTPLRAGRPLRHEAVPPLDAEQIEALAGVIGRAPEPLGEWRRDLVLSLGAPQVVEAMAALPCDEAQAVTRRHVLRLLAQLVVQAEAALPHRLLVELREGRRLALTLDGPPAASDETLFVELSFEAGPATPLRVELQPGPAGRPEALLSLPIETFEPHVLEGSLLAFSRSEEAPEGRPLVVPVPVCVAFTEESQARLRQRLEDEGKRAVVLAEASRRREAVALLDRLVADVAAFHDGQLIAAEIQAGGGDFEAAEAYLAAIPAESPVAAGVLGLRARMALRAGRFEEAQAAFAALGQAEGLRGRAMALLAAAAEPPEAAPAPHDALALLRHQALRVFRDPSLPTLPLAVALAGGLDGAAGEALSMEVASALALVFAPAATQREFLREVDARGTMPIEPFLKNPETRPFRHLMLGGLAGLAVDRIPGSDLPLAIARLLDSEGQSQAALPFAEAAVKRAPKNFDAYTLAAQICRRLQAADQAATYLDEALRLKPDDARTIDRIISFEIEALKLDPLRPTARLESLQASRLEAMQKALLKTPRLPAARLEYARFAALAERHEEAVAILRGLVRENPEWTEPRAMLIRIAQLRNDHPGVLEWFAQHPTEEIDERIVVAAAKAMRGLADVDGAQALLEAHLDKGWPTVRREYVRNLFFNARFEDAEREAARLLAADPGDVELRFLAAAANLELGRNELAFFHAAWIQMHGGSRQFPLEMPLFLYAVLHRNGDPQGALAQLDPMFARVGAQPVGLDPRLGAETFDQLTPTNRYPAAPGHAAPVFEGPLVSVVMTTYNVEAYVRTAVRSVLQQSYRNLELIIVDDCSSDRTPAILAELEASDPRIKVILKSTNDGTYVSKNLGLLQAQGEFAAFQDSDDWSHPDRLACSVGVLLRNPNIVGLTTDWLRMTTGGDIVIKAGGQISHVCCISLVCRRLPTLNRIGFFDSVRIAADLELIQRLGLAFGAKNVPRLRWPLLFGRARSDSLTASEEFGLSRIGFTEPRELYHRHADAFHERIRAGASGYIPFPLRQRLFEAPAMILPKKGAA